MRRKHQISQIYPVPIEQLWQDVLNLNSLAEAMHGAIHYEGLPSGAVVTGQKIVVSLKRWGWMPMGRWTMEILRRDDANHILESREHGNLVRQYAHRLELIALSEEETQYTDHIDVDAGIFTPLVFPMFTSMYEDRHLQRRRRLVPATVN